MTKLTKNVRWVGILLAVVAIVALVFALSFQQLYANPTDGLGQDQVTNQTIAAESFNADNSADYAKTAEIDETTDIEGNLNEAVEPVCPEDESTSDSVDADVALKEVIDESEDSDFSDSVSTSKENAKYTIKFAMPQEYVGRLATAGIRFFKTPRDCVSMQNTGTVITVENITYRVFTATIDSYPTADSFINVCLDIPSTLSSSDSTLNSLAISQWYSNAWQVGENVVAVPINWQKWMPWHCSEGSIVFNSCTVSDTVADNDNDPIEGATASFN